MIDILIRTRIIIFTQNRRCGITGV